MHVGFVLPKKVFFLKKVVIVSNYILIITNVHTTMNVEACFSFTLSADNMRHSAQQGVYSKTATIRTKQWKLATLFLILCFWRKSIEWDEITVKRLHWLRNPKCRPCRLLRRWEIHFRTDRTPADGNTRCCARFQSSCTRKCLPKRKETEVREGKSFRVLRTRSRKPTWGSLNTIPTNQRPNQKG